MGPRSIASMDKSTSEPSRLTSSRWLRSHPRPPGLIAQFNEVFDTSTINLVGNGLADVVLTGPNGLPILGSLVTKQEPGTIQFLATQTNLGSGNYTLTLRIVGSLTQRPDPNRCRAGCGGGRSSVGSLVVVTADATPGCRSPGWRPGSLVIAGDDPAGPGPAGPLRGAVPRSLHPGRWPGHGSSPTGSH